LGHAVFAAPANVAVTLPVGDATRPAANCVETVNVAGPVPDAGETASHGVVAAAVHVTVPAPVCTRRTVCAGVWEVNAVPLLTAPKATDVLSRPIVGGVATAPMLSTPPLSARPVPLADGAIVTVMAPVPVSATS